MVYTGFWLRHLKEKEHLEVSGIDGKIILKWDGGMNWIDLAHDRDVWLGFCKCGNEPSGSIKCKEFLDYLRTC